MIWTVLPLSLTAAFSPDALASMMLCVYPLVCPFIWVCVALWRPDKTKQTILLGLAGHLILAGVFWVIASSTEGSSYYFAYEMVVLFVIVSVIALSALGSSLTLFLCGQFLNQERKSPVGQRSR